MFAEIAENLAAYQKILEARKKLQDAKEDLGRQPGVAESAEGADIARDPVCGMHVERSKSRYTSTYKGRKYHFCSVDCKKAFEIAPKKHSKE